MRNSILHRVVSLNVMLNLDAPFDVDAEIFHFHAHSHPYPVAVS